MYFTYDTVISQNPNSNELDREENKTSTAPNVQIKLNFSIICDNNKNDFNTSASRRELRAKTNEKKAKKKFVSCEILFNFFHLCFDIKSDQGRMRLFLKMSEIFFRLFIISRVNHDQHWPCAICLYFNSTPYLLPLSLSCVT